MTTDLLPPEKGVAFNAPPSHRIGAITEAITNAAQTLAPNEKFALVGVWNNHGGNAAFVARVHDGDRFTVHVLSWIGKEWDKGGFEYGAAVRVAGG